MEGSAECVKRNGVDFISIADILHKFRSLQVSCREAVLTKVKTCSL